MLRLGPERRNVLGNVALLAAVAALFRLPRLGLPSEEIFDEVYHAKTALQYLRGEPLTEWVHPPTAKLLIAVPIHFLQYDSWAWRLAPALAGIALAPVFYLLARRVLATERAALLATFLLLCDGVYLVQSRTAMTNIFAVLFQVAAAAAVLSAVPAERLNAGGMVLGGLALGLAVSTRWTSLGAWGFLGLVTLFTRRKRLLRPRELALLVLAFAVLPAIIYTASYVPLLRYRNSFDTWAGIVAAARDLVQEQRNVWGYHANLRAEHPYFSAWYTWPWLYRPTWYYYNQTQCTVRGIVAIGNPALWWASVPVVLLTLATGALRRDGRRLLLVLGFCCLYLPWGLSPRTLNYSHYLFEALPYACLALGYWLDRGWDDARFSRPCRVYAAAAGILFFYFLPFLVAFPVPVDWFYEQLRLGGWTIRPWTWFPTWV